MSYVAIGQANLPGADVLKQTGGIEERTVRTSDGVTFTYIAVKPEFVAPYMAQLAKYSVKSTTNAQLPFDGAQRMATITVAAGGVEPAIAWIQRELDMGNAIMIGDEDLIAGEESTILSVSRMALIPMVQALAQDGAAVLFDPPGGWAGVAAGPAGGPGTQPGAPPSVMKATLGTGTWAVVAVLGIAGLLAIATMKKR